MAERQVLVTKVNSSMIKYLFWVILDFFYEKAHTCHVVRLVL